MEKGLKDLKGMKSKSTNRLPDMKHHLLFLEHMWEEGYTLHVLDGTLYLYNVETGEVEDSFRIPSTSEDATIYTDGDTSYIERHDT